MDKENRKENQSALSALRTDRLSGCLSGYHTVEAAFVMTIGLLAVCLLLHLALHLHEEQCRQAEQNRAADPVEGFCPEKSMRQIAAIREVIE